MESRLRVRGVLNRRPSKLILCVYVTLSHTTEAGGASTRRLPSPLPSGGPMRLGVRPEIVYGSLVQAVDGLTALASRSALHSSGPLRSLMGLAGGRDPSEPSPLALFMNKGTCTGAGYPLEYCLTFCRGDFRHPLQPKYVVLTLRVFQGGPVAIEKLSCSVSR